MRQTHWFPFHFYPSLIPLKPIFHGNLSIPQMRFKKKKKNDDDFNGWAREVSWNLNILGQFENFKTQIKQNYYICSLERKSLIVGVIVNTLGLDFFWFFLSIIYMWFRKCYFAYEFTALWNKEYFWFCKLWFALFMLL